MTALGHSEQSATAALLKDLSHASDSLPGIAKRLESEFLSAGDAIAAICDLGDNLVRASERLSTLALGGHGGESAMQRATEVLRGPLTFLESGSERTRHVIELLRDYHGRLRTTLARETESRRILAPLTYVQSLLRIEASRLDPEVERMLHDLVKDIERLQLHVEEVFGEKFRTLHDTHQSLGHLVGELTGQVHVHEETAARRAGEIEAAVRAIRDTLAQRARREVRLTAISKEIHVAAGRLVMALQFQDIVAQKLEHVHETCADMQARESDIRAADPAVVATAYRFIETAGRIVLSQLDVAQIEIEDAEKAVDDAVHAIAERMTALDQACLDMQGIEVVSAGANGMVQVMLEAITQVSDLLREGRVHVTHASAVVEPIAAVASDVTNRLRTLAHGMHLVGLNAEVQAARVTNAGGLEVLAATTSAIAQQTRGVSAEVAADVEALIAALTEALTILRGLASDGSVQSERVAQDRPAAETELHAFRDETLKGFDEVGTISSALERDINRVVERVRFEDLFTSGLESFRRGVASVVAIATVEADRIGLPVDLDAITTGVRSRYTMESERRVHDATISGGRVAARRDLRGGHVEMFDEPAPAAASSAPAETEPWTSGDVELWG